MTKRLFRGVLVASAALALGASAIPAAAHAEATFFPECAQAAFVCIEGPQVAGHSGSEFCEWDNNGTLRPNAAVCVDRVNDVMWVKDTADDGRSGMGYILGSGGTWYICRNKHQNGSWARCNFDWPENRAFGLYVGDADFDSGGSATDPQFRRTFND